MCLSFVYGASGRSNIARSRLQTLRHAAHRNLRRTRAPLAHLLKVVLYDTVLERVIRDDADTSARVEPPGGGIKPSFEHIELVIDLDANGLETFLGRVSTMPTSGSWDTRLDDLDKLAGGFESGRGRVRYRC